MEPSATKFPVMFETHSSDYGRGSTVHVTLYVYEFFSFEMAEEAIYRFADASAYGCSHVAIPLYAGSEARARSGLAR